jgi:S1-C subfamily serine protease
MRQQRERTRERSRRGASCRGLVSLLALTVGLMTGCRQTAIPSPEATAGGTPKAGTGTAPDTMGPVAATAEENAVIRVVKQTLPSVISVERDGGLGSGVFIRADGVVLTNAHVVGDAKSVRIGLVDGRRLTGRVLGRDPSVDIGVVKVEGQKFPAAPLADSDKLQVGQTAIAIGNPLGLDRTVTTGVVSATNRSPREIELDSLIQTDAAINPGNSGGPLLDSQGRVIGINTAMFSAPGGGLGFAVPINVARDVAQQIIATGRVRRAVLGVALGDVTPEIAARLELPVSEGAAILAVTENSPAAAAGLQAGDIVIRADDKPITSSGDLRRTIRAREPGATITLTVRRGSAERQVSARLEAVEPR